MSHAAAKTSKLALAKGGKFMLPVAAGIVGDFIMPPVDFSFSDTEGAGSYRLFFTWGAPTSGVAPEQYLFDYYTALTGWVNYIINPPEPREFEWSSVPYGTEWQANIYSQNVTLSLLSYAVTLTGTIPDAPYP
jgi:hypothetical protein